MEIIKIETTIGKHTKTTNSEWFGQSSLSNLDYINPPEKKETLFIKESKTQQESKTTQISDNLSMSLNAQIDRCTNTNAI